MTGETNPGAWLWMLEGRAARSSHGYQTALFAGTTDRAPQDVRASADGGNRKRPVGPDLDSDMDT